MKGSSRLKQGIVKLAKWLTDLESLSDILPSNNQQSATKPTSTLKKSPSTTTSSRKSSRLKGMSNGNQETIKTVVKKSENTKKSKLLSTDDNSLNDSNSVVEDVLPEQFKNPGKCVCKKRNQICFLHHSSLKLETKSTTELKIKRASVKGTSKNSESKVIVLRDRKNNIKNAEKSNLYQDGKSQELKRKRTSTTTAGTETKLKRSKIDPIAKENVKRKECLICQRTETPKWRQGPKGPNTLCNSCGVKWKRGQITIPLSPESPVNTELPETALNPSTETIQEIVAEEQIVEQVDYFRVQSPETAVEDNDNMDKFVEDPLLIFNESTPFHDHFETNQEYLDQKPLSCSQKMMNDFDILPKKFNLPRVNTAIPQDEPYYPYPSQLDSPQDRKQFLEQQMQQMSAPKLAQILMLLDPRITRDLKRAASHKQTPVLDVMDISDDTWYQICSIIMH